MIVFEIKYKYNNRYKSDKMNLFNYILPNPNSMNVQDTKRVFGKDITNICRVNDVKQLKKITMHSEQMNPIK